MSFLFAPAAGAANSRAPQSATPLCISVKNTPPIRDKHAYAVRTPRRVGVEKVAARTERIADATRVPRIIGADKNKKSPRCGDFRKKPAPDGTGSSFKLK